MRCVVLLVVGSFVGCAAAVVGQSPTEGKKVIAFCEPPGESFFATFSTKPHPSGVTGIVLGWWLPGKERVENDFLNPQAQWSPEEFAPLVQRWQAVRKSLPDSLLRLNLGHATDWYDEGAWAGILAKARLLADVVARAGFRGYCLDTEQYNTRPFMYSMQAHAGNRSFQEYQSQVRARGRQLGAALASSKADVTVLFTFAHSAAARELEGGLPAARASFGLLPAFVDGMMDGAGQAEFVDGYEAAYGFKAHSEFVEGARHIRRQGRQTSLDRRRYARRMKVGFGIWPVGREVDERQPMADQPFSFTPEDLEHATHYAFRESDGLVWLYTGGLRRWWERLPEAYVAAVRDAWKPHPLDRRPPAKAGSALYSLSARGRADVKDADVFQHLKDRYIEVLDLPLRWEFRLDPEDAGRRQEWFRPGSRGGWKPIEIREWWQPQGYMVSGLAWYRVEVDVPPLASTKGVILAFGAVDEQAWVWVNGQFAGEHAFGPEGWQSPFEIEVGRLLRPGRRNLIAVRVHDSAGVGGIWKGVKIMAPR